MKIVKIIVCLVISGFFGYMGPKVQAAAQANPGHHLGVACGMVMANPDPIFVGMFPDGILSAESRESAYNNCVLAKKKHDDAVKTLHKLFWPICQRHSRYPSVPTDRLADLVECTACDGVVDVPRENVEKLGMLLAFSEYESMVGLSDQSQLNKCKRIEVQNVQCKVIDIILGEGGLLDLYRTDWFMLKERLDDICKNDRDMVEMLCAVDYLQIKELKSHFIARCALVVKSMLDANRDTTNMLRVAVANKHKIDEQARVLALYVKCFLDELPPECARLVLKKVTSYNRFDYRGIDTMYDAIMSC
jgi:hypothetical protein